MKIGICMSGQARTIGETWPSIYENLMRPLNGNLFVYSSGNNRIKGTFDPDLPVLPNDCTNRAVATLIEPQFPINTEHLTEVYHSLRHLNSYVQQIYGYRRVWQLMKKNGVHYDIVVRCRPDIEFLKPISLDMFDLDRINLFTKTRDENNNKFMTDIFAIGPNALMEKFFHVFDWVISRGAEELKEPVMARDTFDGEITPHKHWPESILTKYLTDAGCPPKGTSCFVEDVLRIRR